MFLGWKMLIIRKVLDPEHFIRMTNILEKRMTFKAFWDRPREILQIVFLIHIRKPRDWAGRCCKLHMPSHSWETFT